jgi:hypothetical protein
MTSARKLDGDIAQARENILRKRLRAALRGLKAVDRAEIQARVEQIVRESNAAGGNKIGIQGDLRREDSIEVWDVVEFRSPIVGISVETGKVLIR